MRLKQRARRLFRVLTLRPAVSLRARKSRPGDAGILAPNLRTEDVQEIKSASGMTPLQALQVSYEISSPCYTVVTDDEDEIVIAMFGVTTSDNPDVGVVWLLAAPLLVEHSKEFLRKSDEWMARLHKKYPILWNFVDKRNLTHIGWLKRIGVNFIAEHPQHGVDQIPFLEFIHV